MNTFAKNRGWVNPISISVLLIPAALLILSGAVAAGAAVMRKKS